MIRSRCRNRSAKGFGKIRWFEEVIGENLPVIIDKQIILNNNTAVLYIDNQEAKDDYLFSQK